MNLRKIIQEEVAKINEAMMTKKFMKATIDLQDVQLKRQALQKKFVAETEPSLKEKLKQQLIKIHKEVQKAEAKFNSAIMSEPIDLDEKYTEAVIEEGKKDYKELPDKVNEDYSQRARNFRVHLRQRLKDMKPGKKVKIDKLVFKKLPSGDGFTDKRGKFFDHEQVVQAIQKGPALNMIYQNSVRSPRGKEQVDAYVKFEGKLNEMPKGAAKGKGGTTPAPINRWWENDKRQLMSIVYHSQRQLPPSDKGVYNREYINIVNQLQKKFPAPPEIIKIKLKEATVDKSVSERIKSLTPEQKSRLKEKLISKYKK